MRKWSKVITTALWPYCYNTDEERHNHLDLNHEGLSPIEHMLGDREEIMADDFHTWACPVMVLDAKLQTVTGIGPPKWESRARA
eukprot:668686-Ditylum_brightwellii.AAC.1